MSPHLSYYNLQPPPHSGLHGATGASALPHVEQARRPEPDPAKVAAAPEATLREGFAPATAQTVLAGGPPGARGGAALRHVGQTVRDQGAGLVRGEVGVLDSPVRRNPVRISPVPSRDQRQGRVSGCRGARARGCAGPATRAGHAYAAQNRITS